MVARGLDRQPSLMRSLAKPTVELDGPADADGTQAPAYSGLTPGILGRQWVNMRAGPHPERRSARAQPGVVHCSW